MPAGNPMAYGSYAAGQQRAQQDLGLRPAQPPTPKPFQSSAVPAGMPGVNRPASPRPGLSPPVPAPSVGAPPSARLANNAFSTAAQGAAYKNAAFSMGPSPEARALEAKRDTVRQPATNEDRQVATGIDPAFNYLSTPSESDPYTIPRMF